jgi:hypothetical protein
MLLACVAATLAIVAILQVPIVPQNAIPLLLTAAAIAALLYERFTTRRVLAELASQLADENNSHKFDVMGALGAPHVDHALNRLVQRVREHETVTKECASTTLPPAATADTTMQVVALSVGVRRERHVDYSADQAARLLRTASAALAATEEQPCVLVQGDGTLLLIFGSTVNQPITLSLRYALQTAHALQSDPHLRFGLGVGSARQCPLPGGTTALIGAPLDDAARLQRMAAAWHEYHLLCAEPVALLARSHRNQRTTLKLTSPSLPPLPVYALELATPSPVAKSA